MQWTNEVGQLKSHHFADFMTKRSSFFRQNRGDTASWRPGSHQP